MTQSTWDAHLSDGVSNGSPPQGDAVPHSILPRDHHNEIGVSSRKGPPAPMPSVTALRRWLVFVALLRLFSVYLGVFQYKYFQSNLFDQAPELVNELYGRTFATWTVTTCALCLICAKNPRLPAIYGATLISFLAALVHFSLELLVFKTMSLKSAANPLIIAGLSALWMGAGWNYYTNLASEVEVSETESIEEASKLQAQKQE